jgi:hypothetical protein
LTFTPDIERPNDAYLIRIDGFTSNASTPIALGNDQRR